MIYYLRVYDNKKTNINSKEFKEKITEEFKEIILRDWDNLVKLESYNETNGNIKEYHTTVSLQIEHP